ncbi:MAG: DUF1844 domain-containing protein [Myxococcota bacterium]
MPPEAREGKGFQIVDEVSDEAGAAAPQSGKAEALPPIGFGTFVLSLSTSALVHMGAAPAPGRSEPGEPNLPLAEQTIEILAMLQEKTRGNLDEDEARLLESLLHDLRMRFVEVRERAR